MFCCTRQLCDDYGVTMNVNKVKNVVVVRGDPEKVDAVEPVARQQVKDAIRAEAVVPFPNDRLGSLLGPKGTRVRQLQVGGPVPRPTVVAAFRPSPPSH
jgi:hypothetical protein